MPAKLTYFTIKALAEPLRYMMSYRNIEFEDIRLDMETWRASVKKTAPFGTAPILEIDGKTLIQHKAICRYMAREAGIAGDNAWEDLQIDIIVDTISDIRVAAADYKFELDAKKKAEKRDPLYNEALPFYFKKFEDIVKENNGHVANKKTSKRVLQSSMASEYKLTYFTLKGLAESIRYLLSYRNIEFEDIRVDVNTWVSSVKQTTPFGKAPVLEVDGKKLTQSKAICRYLAKEAGLSGNDDWENLQIDIMAETVHDLLQDVVSFYFDPDEKSKAAKKGSLVNETLPFYMKKFDTIVEENNGYVANKRLSWADFFFVGVIEHISHYLDEDVFEPYPNLIALKNTVHTLPGIKEYVEKRPADIPLF